MHEVTDCHGVYLRCLLPGPGNGRRGYVAGDPALLLPPGVADALDVGLTELRPGMYVALGLTHWWDGAFRDATRARTLTSVSGCLALVDSRLVPEAALRLARGARCVLDLLAAPRAGAVTFVCEDGVFDFGGGAIRVDTTAAPRRAARPRAGVGDT